MGNKSGKQRLSKQEIDFLKSNTGYDEVSIKDWYKAFKAGCPDGRLNREEFKKMYSKSYPGGDASQFCDHVFRNFDCDHNGSIDFKEFLLSFDVISYGSLEEKLHWVFR